MEDDDRKKIQLIGILVTIPFVLSVPPIIGWAIGTWIDKKMDTGHIFMYIFIILGFVAAIREFIRIIKNIRQ